MNKKISILVLPMLVFPFSAFAAVATVSGLFDGIAGVISTIIPILIAVAVLVFFWGLVKFVNHAGDEKAIDEGKQLMLWGMIAIFVMVALWGIIGWLQAELGLNTATSLGDLSEQFDGIPIPP